MNYSILQWIILLIAFIPMSISDIRNKKISIWFVVCVGIAGILITSLYDMPPFSELIIRFLPGFVLLLVAYLTKECIGKGDGIMCIALGAILKPGQLVASIFYGFILSAIVGLFLIVTRKASRKTRLPFIPFLFGGIIICGIM